MPKPNKATQEKRKREHAKRERKEEKEAKRAQRRENRENKMKSSPMGIDPDLIGIFPGPQPKRDN